MASTIIPVLDSHGDPLYLFFAYASCSGSRLLVSMPLHCIECFFCGVRVAFPFKNARSSESEGISAVCDYSSQPDECACHHLQYQRPRVAGADTWQCCDIFFYT